MIESMFKQWCLNNFFTNASEQATHLFMDRGKIHVPLEKYPEFLHKYFDAVKSGEIVCLVEKLGSNCIMRFFLDVDYKNATRKDEIAQEIVNTADKITGCMGDIYACQKNCGLHIVYNKVVNCSDAIEIADEIKASLPTETAAYIDTSVYKTGLRMDGSCKYTDSDYIQRCYLPLNNDFTFESLKRSIVRIKTIKQQVQMTQCKQDSIVESYIGKTFGLNHVSVLNIKQMGNYVSCVTNSKYCFNVQRNHKNAKTYFVFDLKKRTCYQKCFCTCEKQLPFTMCRNYKSVPHNVPYLLISHLQASFS